MKRLKLFLPLAVFIGLGIFLLQGLEKDPNAMPSALLNQPVPVFELAVLGGNSTVDQTIFTGQPSLINIWATWCGACRIEHPYLNQLAAQGVRIVGVNYKDDPSAALRWLSGMGVPYTLSVMDLDGTLGVDLGVFGAPETYLVDGSGVIRAKHVGVLNDAVWQTKIGPLWKQLAENTDSNMK